MQMVDQATLGYYASPGRFTTLDGDEFSSDDISRAVDVVQGLLVYDVVAKPFYDVDLTTTQAEAIHERDSARLLQLARSVDSRPIDEARPPANRVGGRCHAYSRLTVAFLRAAGVPARARCGFAGYFLPGWFEDHWVAEYWDATDHVWRMADAQLDTTWRQMVGFDGDPLAITADQFLTAPAAWQAWRRGELDPDRCGLSAIDEHGAFWIASNLRLDLASLNKVEMLPWDLWGAGWGPDEEPTEDQLQLFDEVAAMTIDPDNHIDALRARYQNDDQLRMDGTVFSATRNQVEQIEG